MSENEPLQVELKQLIVDVLSLEEVTAAEIDADAPLFGDGLGLDSIDALEIAMVLEERYGVTLEEDPEENQKIFQCVRSLSAFVAASRGE